MRTRPGSSTPLSVPAFRRVWAGVTVSAAGDAAGWVALVALALGPAHASLPLLAACYTMPVAIGGLAAGWALDRFGRVRTMVADNLVRGAVFASIPLAAVVAPPGAAQVYLVAAAYGLLMMVTLAGFPALIPLLVPATQLGQANALEGAGYGLASLAGAAMGGLAVATVGPVPVVAFDAASYLVLAVILLSVRGLQAQARRAGSQLSGARGGAGLAAVARLVISNPVLRATTIMFAVFNIGEGALLVLLPHRAAGLGLGTGGYGYLVATVTGGELAATAFLARRPWQAPLLLSIIIAQLTAALAVLALLATSLAATLLGLVVLGACSAPMTAWAQTLRMRLVPEQAHGRLFALLRTVMQATPPLGAGLAALTMRLGGAATVWAVVAAMGLPALLFAPWLLAAPAGEDASGGPPAGAIGRCGGQPGSGAPRCARGSR
jgi:MFS transporter